jgi:hypothetical protein
LDLQPNALQERVKFIYEQALLTLNKYSDVWIEIVEYNLENHLLEEVEDYYKRSIFFNPTSALLHFSYCFYLEESNLFFIYTLFFLFLFFIFIIYFIFFSFHF